MPQQDKVTLELGITKVRPKPALKTLLKRAAAENQRSVHGEIIFRLTKSFEQSKRRATQAAQ